MDDWKFPFRDRFPAPTPYFHSTKLNFCDKFGTTNLGYRSRIALKIYEHVPANNVYTVVKFYANPRLQKRNCFFGSASDLDRLP